MDSDTATFWLWSIAVVLYSALVLWLGARCQDDWHKDRLLEDGAYVYTIIDAPTGTTALRLRPEVAQLLKTLNKTGDAK